jgi:hypothetical protein
LGCPNLAFLKGLRTGSRFLGVGAENLFAQMDHLDIVRALREWLKEKTALQPLVTVVKAPTPHFT